MTKRKITLLSNVTVDLISRKLRNKYDVYIPEGFDTWVQEVINPDSPLYSNDVDAVVILLDGTEARSWRDVDEANERIALWKQATRTFSGRCEDIPIFVSTIDIRENRIKSLSEKKYRYEFENEWYQFVQSINDEKGNVYVVDIADTISDIGRNNFYSNKMWYMSSMPYSRDGLNAIAKEIDIALDAAFAERKKIAVLDLDNTLWGGVIGEDGIEGIELSDHKEGQRYFDFQRQLLEMKNRGVLLAVDSKNNAKDAEEAIRNHPSMLLRDEDFISKKINWDDKAKNIKEIGNELNITEGGFVFIDDNPIEREIVKGECPEVYVTDFPVESSELLTFAENLWKNSFRPLKVLSEDVGKTDMYRSEAKRKQEFDGNLNLTDYIKKLEIVIDIHKMRDSELDRVVQLIGKTNQFNLTTKRYTKTDVSKISRDHDYEIYVAHSEDKYGDNGLISVVILKNNDDEDVLIDTFLMSCRVMGRGLENVIISKLVERYSDRVFVGEYIPSKKNMPVSDLYENLGFEKLKESKDGNKVYQLKGTDSNIADCYLYKEVRFEE